MAEITNQGNSGKNKHRGHRMPKVAPRVDMTPMVDLGFLLITFFMLSMKMSDPKAMLWVKPIEDPHPEAVSECCVLTVLVDSADRVYTYEGDDLKTMKLSSFDDNTGIMHRLMQKGKKVKAECGLMKNGKPHELVCLIKLLQGTRYQNLTDVVDAMNITKTHYSIQEPLVEEVAALKLKEKELTPLY